MKTYFEPSELIINPDGSCFHLHLLPEQIANKVILVGDPERVEYFKPLLENIECSVYNREFHTLTGYYHGKHLSIVSTGIGCDNIDIVVNELDALANIDFPSRTLKDRMQSLEIVRIGTCGGLQDNTPTGTYVCSEFSIGLDGLLNFYKNRNQVCNLELEKAFVTHMGWENGLCQCYPYVVASNQELMERIAQNDMVRGITIAANGFYGPQGRYLRLELADAKQNEKIQSFIYQGKQILNFEMESSALSGLAKMMGHKAVTCCMVVADRRDLHTNTSYHDAMKAMIQLILDRI